MPNQLNKSNSILKCKMLKKLSDMYKKRVIVILFKIIFQFAKKKNFTVLTGLEPAAF